MPRREESRPAISWLSGNARGQLARPPRILSPRFNPRWTRQSNPSAAIVWRLREEPLCGCRLRPLSSFMLSKWGIYYPALDLPAVVFFGRCYFLDLLDHALLVVCLITVVTLSPPDCNSHEISIAFDVCHSTLSLLSSFSLSFIILGISVKFRSFDDDHLFLFVVDLVHEDIAIEIINPLIHRTSLDLKWRKNLIFVCDSFSVDPRSRIVELETIQSPSHSVDWVLHLPRHLLVGQQ